jgi:hypothetical protein
VRRNHGRDGVWQLFKLIEDKGLTQVLANHNTQFLRDELLADALDSDTRLAVLVNTAHSLLNATEFQWPDLYMKIVHHMLDSKQYERSVRWHLQLTPEFPPSREVFGALLSSFVIDTSPKMQSNLTALYVSSTEKQMYDHIIPVLFAAGLSKLARVWRKKLLAFRDSPMTTKSKPFLRFLATFYPTIVLTAEELEIGGLATKAVDTSHLSPTKAATDAARGQYSDAIVARLFASTWTSVEFAINLAQRLGLRIIGPRSLQSLALRDSDPKTVASRIAQIETLGVAISTQVYCKALVFFAKHGEDTLLADLLACDVHPDEFDDIETRQMLMASSVREENWKMERMLQGIEWAIEYDPSTRRLHAILDHELSKRKLDKARQVLDRMEALKVNMTQQSALKLMERTFWGLGKHPVGRKRHIGSEPQDFKALLDRAIDITRRVALHDVAIPIQFWSVLLYNLGRLGRFVELEQLSVEIAQLYAPPLGGLIPLHAADLPHLDSKAGSGVYFAHQQFMSVPGDGIKLCPSASQEDRQFRTEMRTLASSGAIQNEALIGLNGPVHQESTAQVWAEGLIDLDSKPLPGSDFKMESRITDGRIQSGPDVSSSTADLKEYIPADLPFSHRQHPVQKIFNAHLQRSIVRWGFDQTLKSAPSSASLIDSNSSGIVAFDVASGVRLLASLRDQGVLIDSQILRATIVARIALGQVPGRQKDKSRDRHELSIEYLKSLFDEAWGSEILPSAFELLQQLEHQKPRLWSRYSKLFGQSFDTVKKDIERTRHG